MRRVLISALALAASFTVGFTGCDETPPQCDRLVSPDGNNANAGTSTAAPWRTIQWAANHVSAGQTVCVGAGTYAEKVTFPTGGTSPTNRVTFQAFPGEVPTIDGTGVSLNDSNDGLVNIDGGTNHFMLVGFTIQDSAGRGLVNDGSSNLIVGNTIRRSVNAGIITTNWFAAATNNQYAYNTITDNVRAQLCVTPTSNCTQAGGWESAINNYGGGVGASGGNTYAGNVVAGNHGEGQTVEDGDVLDGNTYADNFSVEVYIDGAHDVTITRNLIYSTETTDPAGNNESYRLIAIGVGLADEGGGTELHSNTIDNNMILGTRKGIDFWNSNQANVRMLNETIDNNTIANGWGVGISFDSPMFNAHAGTLVRDNLIWPRAGVATTSGVYSTSGVTATANLRRGVDPHPGLAGIGTASHDPDDYRIPSTASSAYNAGVATSAAVDYFGVTRPRASLYDIGAHER